VSGVDWCGWFTVCMITTGKAEAEADTEAARSLVVAQSLQAEAAQWVDRWAEDRSVGDWLAVD
jgi:hypothetical protein